MYTTCIYCHQDLGSNEALEAFPVGRRLAFDPTRGRLWVVCRRCERWNLSPLDTRWEVIETCERAYRDTRLRVSSDNIGLARLPAGLELVRVGRPMREEFAAWRYGDQFGRRRKRAILYTTAGVTAIGALVVGGAAAGISMGGIFPGVTQAVQSWWRERTIDRLWAEDGTPIRVQRKHLYTSRLVPAGGEDWSLQVDHVEGWDKKKSRGPAPPPLILSGDEALHLASRLMAHANRRGGGKSTVRAAVARIEDAGHPDAFLPLAAREAERQYAASGKAELSDRKRKRLSKPIPGSLSGLPDDTRLAVEMATQEQAEREALEGELKGLEAMWRQAEEIAHIADNLFVPESVEEFIREERARLRDG